MSEILFGEGTLVDVLLRIFTALAAAAIIGFIRRYRSVLVVTARALGHKLPHPVGNIVRRSADRVYPSWRADSGERRNQLNLEWRIEQVRQLRKNHRFFILGPAYLDIFLSSISITALTSTEISDLEPVRLDCGGSAAYFGRYLYRCHRGERSRFYTRISVKDDIGKELKALLKSEPWIRGLEQTEVKDVQGAISVHLLQRSGDFFTTFTHRGAASSLNWQPQLKVIRRHAKRGGLLYVTGYFRTNLSHDLVFSLAQVPLKLIVLLDHGKFRASEHATAVPSLVQAFRANLIDIYICTFSELAMIMDAARVRVDTTSDKELMLKTLSNSRVLPRLTVVRDRVSAGVATAYYVLDGDVHRVAVDFSDLRTSRRNVTASEFRDAPGVRSAFSASLAYTLVSEPWEQSLRAAAEAAVTAGLCEWLREVG